jgi:dTDP-glucose 4,6-dehydratase
MQADIVDREAIGALSRGFSRRQWSTLLPNLTSTASIDDPSPFIDTNIVGTFVFWRLSGEATGLCLKRPPGNFRFLHVSTDEVYGTLGETGLLL